MSADTCAGCGRATSPDNPRPTHCGDCPPWTCPTCGHLDSLVAPCGCWVSFDGLPLADIKGHLAALNLSVETP